MRRNMFYTHSGEFMPTEFPELESTSLEEIENERVLDFEDEDESPENYCLPPGQSLRFE